MKSSVHALDKFLDKHLQKAIDLKNRYVLNEERKKLQEDLLSGFKKFAVYFWDQASTSNAFIDGISVDCITTCVDAIVAKKLSSVLFSLPLREGKSTLLSVLLPVYLMLHNPRMSFLTATYTTSHAYRDNKAMQDLILSKKFQKVFGDKLSLKYHNQERTRTHQGGIRFAISFEGKGTGAGGDVVILDDPMDLTQISYKSHREHVIATFSRVLYNRRNKFNESILIGAMHRSHSEDLFGYILSKQDPTITYVPVPFLFRSKTKTVVTSPFTGEIIWEDPRTEEDQLLSPARYTEEDVLKIKNMMSKHDFESIYQCNPIAEEGNIIKREWFSKYEKAMFPEFELIIQSWDLAMSTNIHAAYSASTTYGMFKGDDGVKNLLLLNAWYGRLEFPDLIEMIKRQSYNIYDTNLKENPKRNPLSPHIVLIEEKANGMPMIQTLRRSGITNIIPYKVPRQKGSSGTKRTTEEAKVARIRKVSPLIESGRIFLPTKDTFSGSFTQFSEQFISACTNFPNNFEATRDIVDTFSMTLDYLNERQILQSNYEIDFASRMTLLPDFSFYKKERMNIEKPIIWTKN